LTVSLVTGSDRGEDERQMPGTPSGARWGIVDLLVSEVQWLRVPALQEQIMATTVAGVRLWLLVGDAVPDEHHERFAGVTGRVLPWRRSPPPGTSGSSAPSSVREPPPRSATTGGPGTRSPGRPPPARTPARGMTVASPACCPPPGGR
jgi:hypothetical protein